MAENVHPCFYCQNPARHWFINDQGDRRWICTTRTTRNKYSMIVTPVKQCQERARADGYHPDPADTPFATRKF